MVVDRLVMLLRIIVFVVVIVHVVISRHGKLGTSFGDVTCVGAVLVLRSGGAGHPLRYPTASSNVRSLEKKKVD